MTTSVSFFDFSFFFPPPLQHLDDNVFQPVPLQSCAKMSPPILEVPFPFSLGHLFCYRGVTKASGEAWSPLPRKGTPCFLPVEKFLDFSQSESCVSAESTPQENSPLVPLLPYPFGRLVNGSAPPACWRPETPLPSVHHPPFRSAPKEEILLVFRPLFPSQ